jgi:ribosome-associated protein
VDPDDLCTPGGIGIPDTSLTWRFSRSSAPGGQHVNTSSTRAELRCNVTMVVAPDHIRDRLLERIGTELRVSSQQERSQWRNRQRALTRLMTLLDEAAVIDPPRRPTRPSRASIHRRLDAKQRSAERKSSRRWRPDD